MKIGVISDIHLKEALGYAEYIKDGRASEKKEIFNFIVKTMDDCESIVFLGDQFNARNNPSEVIKDFIAFIERFGDKQLFFVAGNHEKLGTGKTAIDFLGELKNKKWTVISNHITKIDNLTFLPYFSKAELGVKNDSLATKQILTQLENNDILFVHHTISDTMTTSGVNTNLFKEIILPKKELESKFKLVVGGHIHKPQADGGTIVVGSIFNQEAGENQKYVWTIDAEKLTVEQIKLPGRGIYRLENPTPEQIFKITNHNIVKVVLTVKKRKETVEEIRTALQRFDAYILLEQYPSERKKVIINDNILEYDVVQLLEIYAKEKKIDFEKLKSAYELINK